MTEETKINELSAGPGEDRQPAEKSRVYYVTQLELYDHGFLNGIIQIPRFSFEEFIAQDGLHDLAKKELGITLGEIEAEKARLKATHDRRLELENTVSACKWAIQANTDIREQKEKALETGKNALAAKEQQIQEFHIEYGSISAVIFIIMGGVFLAADFFVTLDVMHKGLDMEFLNALALSLAMCGITFVIKPMIDRIFEQPFLRGKTSRQHALLITVSVVAIAVLGLLGYYREEYLKTDMAIKVQEQKIDDAKNNIKKFVII
jgi:hypothetical protein